MNYKSKYLKYKFKYLLLKNLLSGGGDAALAALLAADDSKEPDSTEYNTKS